MTTNATASNLMGLGMHPELAAVLSEDLGGDIVLTAAGDTFCFPTAVALSGAGTDLAGATQLTKALNSVSTAGASSGVKLWRPDTVGAMIVVKNSGANDLKVYPPDASGTINFGSAGAAITLTTAAKQLAIFFYILAPNTWIAGTMSASA